MTFFTKHDKCHSRKIPFTKNSEIGFIVFCNKSLTFLLVQKSWFMIWNIGNIKLFLQNKAHCQMTLNYTDVIFIEQTRYCATFPTNVFMYVLNFNSHDLKLKTQHIIFLKKCVWCTYPQTWEKYKHAFVVLMTNINIIWRIYFKRWANQYMRSTPVSQHYTKNVVPREVLDHASDIQIHFFFVFWWHASLLLRVGWFPISRVIILKSGEKLSHA